MAGAGFEPAPFQTSALNWRLRPLGQPTIESPTQLIRINKSAHIHAKQTTINITQHRHYNTPRVHTKFPSQHDIYSTHKTTTNTEPTATYTLSTTRHEGLVTVVSIPPASHLPTSALLVALHHFQQERQSEVVERERTMRICFRMSPGWVPLV